MFLRSRSSHSSHAHARLMRLALLGALGCAVLFTATRVHAAAPDEVKTVPEVDLKQYVGKWYEIGNFPMFFQRKCVSDTTAEYGALPDGKISVLNRCRTKDGSFDEADGEAKVVPDSGNAKLKVTFFKPFSGDYWIIGLDPDYKWSVVGSPDRKYLWILSRTPTLTDAQMASARQAALDQGYTLDKFRLTPQGQDGANGSPPAAR